MPKPKDGPLYPMVNKSMLLPPTGISTAYALPPGCRAVDCIIDGAVGWIEIGYGNTVADNVTSHFIWKDNLPRRFNVPPGATHIIYLDNGAQMRVSCYE